MGSSEALGRRRSLRGSAIENSANNYPDAGNKCKNNQKWRIWHHQTSNTCTHQKYRAEKITSKRTRSRRRKTLGNYEVVSDCRLRKCRSAIRRTCHALATVRLGTLWAKCPSTISADSDCFRTMCCASHGSRANVRFCLFSIVFMRQLQPFNRQSQAFLRKTPANGQSRNLEGDE